MGQLYIEASKNTPEILFDTDRNEYSITGISTPLNAFEFYSHIISWLNVHEAEIQSNAAFTFNMPYFNSGSMKALLQLLERIKKAQQQGHQWTIDWLVEDEDEFMIEAAESFQSLLNIQFKIS